MAHSPDQTPLPGASRAGAAPPASARVAGYLLERLLGSGANSAVYRAIDERLGRRVALKVFSDTLTPQTRERFLREVGQVRDLQHPNLVMVYSAGENLGVAWAAMELMSASLSHELLQRGRFSANDLRAVVRDACLGLDAVRARGIMHRDIKPSNLLRGGDGTVKVADFGLANDLSRELNLAATDAVLGTAWYVSPEQAAGNAVGVASDLYSLGATLYHLAAGRPPFDSANALDVIIRHAIEPAPPLPEDVPAAMTRLITWLLDKDPAKRPRDYHAVLSALDDGEPIDGDPDSAATFTQSLLAAARAALQLGRGRRVRSLLEPLVQAHEEGWTQAGFLLATALEASQAPDEARAILEDIVTNASGDEDRALALWNLGRLAEKACALERAVEIYSRLKAIALPRTPVALLDARIAHLSNRHRDRATRPA